MFTNIINIEVEDIVDEMAYVLNKAGVVYTERGIIQQVLDLSLIYTRLDERDIHHHFRKYRQNGLEVKRGVSYAYVLLQDLINQHVDMTQVTPLNITQHAFLPKLKLTVTNHNLDESFVRWLRKRDDEYPIPLEIERLLKEYEYSTGTGTLSLYN